MSKIKGLKNVKCYFNSLLTTLLPFCDGADGLTGVLLVTCFCLFLQGHPMILFVLIAISFF